MDSKVRNSHLFKNIHIMTNKNQISPAAAGKTEVFSFSQEKTPVRVQIINGEPWFMAKDVCRVLGISKYRDAVSRLDDDERGSVLVDTLGGVQSVSAVSESGLYSLIFQSRKAEARMFRRWVTSEVLPSIRRKGRYVAAREKNSDFIDARNIPCVHTMLNGGDVRGVVVDGVVWYSMNDINRSVGVSTGSSQCARKLNAVTVNAVKVLVPGNTHPAWFVSSLGVKLILSGSRKLAAANNRQLMLDFGAV